MNGLVAAPLQLCCDRRFAGAGNALDKIISFAHGSMIPMRVGQPNVFLIAPLGLSLGQA
jgi:hypothetical protein